MSETLYRYWQDDILLYVGITASLANRMYQHGRHSAWWERATHATFERFADRKSVIIAEQMAIVEERPLFNRMHGKNPGAWAIVELDDGDELLDVKGFADYIGVKPQSIYSRRCHGLDMPPTIESGGRVFWSRNAIDAWMTSNQEPAELAT